MSTVATTRKSTTKVPARPLSFPEWRKNVDTVMHSICGLGVDDLPESFGLKERYEAGADITSTAFDAYEVLE